LAYLEEDELLPSFAQPHLLRLGILGLFATGGTLFSQPDDVVGATVELRVSMDHGKFGSVDGASAFVEIIGDDFTTRIFCTNLKNIASTTMGMEPKGRPFRNYKARLKKPGEDKTFQRRLDWYDRMLNAKIASALAQRDVPALFQAKKAFEKFVEARERLPSGGPAEFSVGSTVVTITTVYDPISERYSKWRISKEHSGGRSTETYVQQLKLNDPIPGTFRDELEFKCIISPGQMELGYTLSGDDAEPVISGIARDLPATSGGLRPGMKVLRVNGHPASRRLVELLPNWPRPKHDFLVLDGQEEKRLTLDRSVFIQKGHPMNMIREIPELK